MATRKPNPAKLQKQCDDFNSRCPVGTPVLFWKGVREGLGANGIVRHPATVLGGHTPVAWITGASGCIALTHVQPVQEG